MPEFDIKSSTVEKGLDLAKGFLQQLVGPSLLMKWDYYYRTM